MAPRLLTLNVPTLAFHLKSALYFYTAAEEREMRRLNQGLFLVATALFLGSCGRSSLLGNGGVPPCPEGQFRDADGECVAVQDGGWPDGPQDGPKAPDGCVVMGPEVCDNGVDDDCNGLADCEDEPCKPTIYCCQAIPEICSNHQDDNCNQLIDCLDPYCASDPACPIGHEICTNGIDDDNNSLVDCDDPACELFPGCRQQVPEICDNGVDDNHNGFTDCDDPACVEAPNCRNLQCHPTVDFGPLALNDSVATRDLSTIGTTDVALTPCAPGGGGMVVTEFQVLAPATSVRLDYSQGEHADHVFSLFRAGVNQICEANPVGCYDPQAAPSGHTTWVLPSGHYYLIIQAFKTDYQGALTATLSTPPSTHPEICNNGVDDDGNGLADCDDPGCYGAANCQQCSPDIVVGTLVPGDPPKSASFTTVGKTNDSFLTCAAGGGGEVVVQFTLKEGADLLLGWQQTNDQVVGLFRKPGLGYGCDALPLGCFDPAGQSHINLDWSGLGPGDYLLVFQGHSEGSEGYDEITLQAYKNRPVELCHNDIDDDGNSLTDCDDPACATDPGCGASACFPDVNLGALSPGGPPNTMTLNTVGGVPNEAVSCAQGSGRSRIIQFSLPVTAGVYIDCGSPGDHVLGLFLAQGSRDPCDEIELGCADLAHGPFGCNFVIPNMEPGSYYFIVQAFQQGAEGVISDLSIMAIDDREPLELCGNHIDDDSDGFTDCADIKCKDSPHCAPYACTPEHIFTPLPATGAVVHSSALTLAKSAVAAIPCATLPDGGASVTLIGMPVEATLTIAYSQVGQHAFAVYPNLAAGLVCDAGPIEGCSTTEQNSSGTLAFRLPQGQHYIVVSADQPGREGLVYPMDLSALP